MSNSREIAIESTKAEINFLVDKWNREKDKIANYRNLLKAAIKNESLTSKKVYSELIELTKLKLGVKICEQEAVAFMTKCYYEVDKRKSRDKMLHTLIEKASAEVRVKQFGFTGSLLILGYIVDTELLQGLDNNCNNMYIEWRKVILAEIANMRKSIVENKRMHKDIEVDALLHAKENNLIDTRTYNHLSRHVARLSKQSSGSYFLDREVITKELATFILSKNSIMDVDGAGPHMERQFKSTKRFMTDYIVDIDNK